MENITVTKLGEGRGMSLLASSFAFFIDTAFILSEPAGYRLVVIHNRRVLTDKLYDSLRGARIAFTRLYGDRCCHGDVAADWTIFYHPSPGWLNDRLNVLGKEV